MELPLPQLTLSASMPGGAVCLQVLASTDASLAKIWLDDCRHAFAELTAEKQTREAAEAKQEVRAGRGGGLCCWAAAAALQHLLFMVLLC